MILGIHFSGVSGRFTGDPVLHSIIVPKQAPLARSARHDAEPASTRSPFLAALGIFGNPA
jgi:hypothetical protein